MDLSGECSCCLLRCLTEEYKEVVLASPEDEESVRRKFARSAVTHLKYPWKSSRPLYMTRKATWLCSVHLHEHARNCTAPFWKIFQLLSEAFHSWKFTERNIISEFLFKGYYVMQYNYMYSSFNSSSFPRCLCKKSCDIRIMSKEEFKELLDMRYDWQSDTALSLPNFTRPAVWNAIRAGYEQFLSCLLKHGVMFLSEPYTTCWERTQYQNTIANFV